MSMINHPDSALVLLCLETAGVDNWEGYDIALDKYRDTGVEGPGAMVSAMAAVGVDNWDGYDIAAELFEDYLAQHGEAEPEDIPAGDTAPEAEPEGEPAPEPVVEALSQQRLRMIAAARPDVAVEGFWKRNNPLVAAHWDTVVKSMAGKGESLEDTRMALLDAVFGKEPAE